MKILIVDDDSISRLLLRKIIEQESIYHVTEAVDGQKAWELLDQGFTPDLCVLDLMMPGIQGLHLLQKLRSHPRFKAIKVIVCTAATQRQSVEQAASLEIAAYLLKPFSAQKLLLEIEKVRNQLGAAAPLHDPAGARARLGIDLPFYRQLLSLLTKETDQWLAKTLVSDAGEFSAEFAMRVAALKSSSQNLNALALWRSLAEVESAYSELGQPHLSAAIKKLAAENKRLKTALAQIAEPARAATPSAPPIEG